MKCVLLLLIEILLASPFVQAHLFDQSIRRDPQPAERQALVQLGLGRNAESADYGCAAFFIQNSNNRFLVGSARHCVSFEAEKKCRLRQLHVKAASTLGTCQRVLIESEVDDFFIFEVTLRGPREDNLKNIKFLTLNSIDYTPGLRLQVLGFPVDSYRNGLATVSENCWIQDIEGKTIFYSTAPIKNLSQRESLNEIGQEQKKEQTQKQNQETRSAGPPIQQDYSGSVTYNRKEALALLKIQQAANILPHNCSVFGGNSGGPMIKAGTNLVVGLPFSYSDREEIFPGESSFGLMESVSGLCERYSSRLRKEGVTISYK